MQKARKQNLKKKILERRMGSLVKSSVNEKITLEIGPRWAYGVESKILFYPITGEYNVFKLTIKQIIGVLLHEISHARYSEPIESFGLKEPRKIYATCLNGLEDLRVERKLMKDFPGTYDSFHTLVKKHEKDFVLKKLKEIEDYMVFILNVRNHDWNIPYCFTDKKIEEAFLDCTPAIEEAIQANSSEELNTILKDKIWHSIKKLIPPASESPSKSKTSSEEGEGDGDGDEEDEDEDKDISDLKDIIKAVSKKSRKDKDEKTIEQEINDEIKKIEREETKEVDGTIKDKKIEMVKKERPYRTYQELYNDISCYISYFSRHLQSIMEDNKMERFGGAYRSGKLNNKILYKWKCNKTNLFSKKIFRMHREYRVTLLVDESGSMGGEKSINAARGTVLMAEVLSKVNIPFEIIGFNGSERIYKTFEDNFSDVTKKNLENIIPSVHTADGADNNDGYAVNLSSHRLQQQPGEKILIVFSDGMPVNGCGQIPEEDKKRLPSNLHYYNEFSLETEIKKARQNATIIGIGIGFDADHVSSYYPQHVVCDEIDELPKLTLNMLRRNIKRG